MEPDRCIYVVPRRLDGPSPPQTLYALGAQMVAEVQGKELAGSWSLSAHVPVVDPRQSPVLSSWVPYHPMHILQQLLRAVPVDNLTGRVLHAHSNPQASIEAALADTFGFTKEAQKAMCIGELGVIFRAVEKDINWSCRWAEELKEAVKVKGRKYHVTNTRGEELRQEPGEPGELTDVPAREDFPLCVAVAASEEHDARLRKPLETVKGFLESFGEERGALWFEGAISAPTLYYARNQDGWFLAILSTAACQTI